MPLKAHVRQCFHCWGKCDPTIDCHQAVAWFFNEFRRTVPIKTNLKVPFKPSFMNFPYRLSAISLLTGSIIFTSCQKNQFIPEVSPEDELLAASKNKSCPVTEFRCTYNTPEPMQVIVYSKTFRPNGKLDKITAAVYSGGAIIGTSTYSVHWKNDRVALIHDGSTDTLLVGMLSQNGRVAATRDGDKPDFQYLSTSFDYSNNKVNTMKIHFSGNDLLANFHYSNGNVTRIDDIGDGNTAPGKIEYQYATGNKINQQQYFDEPR